MTAFHGPSAQIRGDGTLASMSVTRNILCNGGLFKELNMVTEPKDPGNEVMCSRIKGSYSHISGLAQRINYILPTV